MLSAKEIFSDKFRLTEIRKKKKGKKERKKKKKSLPVFIEIQPNFVGIIVDGSPISLLRAFWKKKIKSA